LALLGGKPENREKKGVKGSYNGGTTSRSRGR